MIFPTVSDTAHLLSKGLHDADADDEPLFPHGSSLASIDRIERSPRDYEAATAWRMLIYLVYTNRVIIKIKAPYDQGGHTPGIPI